MPDEQSYLDRAKALRRARATGCFADGSPSRRPEKSRSKNRTPRFATFRMGRIRARSSTFGRLRPGSRRRWSCISMGRVPGGRQDEDPPGADRRLPERRDLGGLDRVPIVAGGPFSGPFPGLQELSSSFVPTSRSTTSIPPEWPPRAVRPEAGLRCGWDSTTTWLIHITPTPFFANPPVWPAWPYCRPRPATTCGPYGSGSAPVRLSTRMRRLFRSEPGRNGHPQSTPHVRAGFTHQPVDQG